MATPDDPDAFRMLWYKAATRAQAERRHLLLVVDGLDEDMSRSKGLPRMDKPR